VSGKITDADTGKPVRAWVAYLIWANNPELKKLSEPYESNNPCMTDAEGRYRLVVPPGTGVFTAQGDQEYEPAQTEDFGLPVDRIGNHVFFESANRGLVEAAHFHALKKIEPTPQTEYLGVDFVLSPGKPILGRVVDPQGQPVRDVEARGLRS